MHRILLFITLIFCAAHSVAQTYLWDNFIEDYLNECEDEEQDIPEDWEEMLQLHEHPFNINLATEDDLRLLPFLSERQIASILDYISMHGQMQTLKELDFIPNLDALTRQWISLFVFAEGTKKHEAPLLAQLRSDLSTRIDIPLYYRKGYLLDDGYASDALYHRVRYELGNQQHFKAGFHMEKDAGERYYDSYSAHIMLHHVGILQQAIVGDYRISFGQGLVVGSNTWFGKSLAPSHLQNSIKAQTGMGEDHFLRGAAVTLRPHKYWQASVFGSYKDVDATLNKEGDIQTLKYGGLHRSKSEIAAKNVASSTVAGGNITFQNKNFILGATTIYQHFGKPLQPGDAIYRQHYPAGQNFSITGLHYGYNAYRLQIAGETAYSSTDGGGVATINSVRWTQSSRFILTLQQRYYGTSYHSFYATSYAENSEASNESGFQLHVQAEPLRGWHMLSYLDLFHNPWPRYGLTHSSTGQAFMLQISRSLSHRHQMNAQYQMKRKEKSNLMQVHHRTRLQWIYAPSNQIRCTTTLRTHHLSGLTGWNLQHTTQYSLQKPDIRLAGSLTWFDATHYDTRLYVYEPSLYHTISSFLTYGRGLHGCLTARWTSKAHRLMIEGKYSLTKYTDRNQQSSGLQTIFSPWKNDVSVQMRLRI